MYFDPRTFVEQPAYRELNAEIAENSCVSPALLSTGEPGVLVRFGRSFGVVSTADAIKLATLIADMVDTGNNR